MIQVEVEDLDTFWIELQDKKLTEKFKVRLREPTNFL